MDQTNGNGFFNSIYKSVVARDQEKWRLIVNAATPSRKRTTDFLVFTDFGK